MNSQKLIDTNTLASERSRIDSGIAGGKSAVITLPEAKRSSQAPSGSNTGTSSQAYAKDSDLAKNVQEMIQDMHEIIAKVDEFQFQMKIAWKHQKGTP